jgi:hypothetical protein
VFISGSEFAVSTFDIAARHGRRMSPMRTVYCALLAPLLLIAIDPGNAADARERISCTARNGCLFGKDSRKPIAGWTCQSRHSHARSYYFCTPGANG